MFLSVHSRRGGHRYVGIKAAIPFSLQKEDEQNQPTIYFSLIGYGLCQVSRANSQVVILGRTQHIPPFQRDPPWTGPGHEVSRYQHTLATHLLEKNIFSLFLSRRDEPKDGMAYPTLGGACVGALVVRFRLLGATIPADAPSI